MIDLQRFGKVGTGFKHSVGVPLLGTRYFLQSITYNAFGAISVGGHHAS